MYWCGVIVILLVLSNPVVRLGKHSRTPCCSANSELAFLHSKLSLMDPGDDALANQWWKNNAVSMEQEISG